MQVATRSVGVQTVQVVNLAPTTRGAISGSSKRMPLAKP
jgi:hypothetical protein